MVRLCDREVVCSASDNQGSNVESCVWISSHNFQEVSWDQFSLYEHKCGQKPHLFFHLFVRSFFRSFIHSFIHSFISEPNRHDVFSGFTAGSQEVQYFTETHNMSYSSVDIAGQFVHGQMVYVTVRCVNYAGLLSILSSDGVVMTPDPPITNNAYVDVIINPVSHFPPRNNHQVQDDTVIFGWNQFHHPTLIPYYEVRKLFLNQNKLNFLKNYIVPKKSNVF